MLVNIHFQKYNRYKFLESYLYCNNGGLESRQKTSFRRFKRKLSVKGHTEIAFLINKVSLTLQPALTANVIHETSRL